MNILHFTIVIFTILSIDAFSQPLPLQHPSLMSGWHRVWIKNVGSFDLPSSMEIQAGKYKEGQNAIYNRLELDAPQIVAQQSGLNELEEGGLAKYSRVMIETSVGNYNDFEKLNFDFNDITFEELDQINSMYHKQFITELSNIGVTIIKWYPLQFEAINGMSCIHIHYERQLSNNPAVNVNEYLFHNNDRIHKFTLSYRISESAFWKNDFNTVLRSLRITNIK